MVILSTGRPSGAGGKQLWGMINLWVFLVKHESRKKFFHAKISCFTLLYSATGPCIMLDNLMTSSDSLTQSYCAGVWKL